jgi:hypothetical protein
MDKQFSSCTEHLRVVWEEHVRPRTNPAPGDGGGKTYDEWLLANVSSWCTWQKTWLDELRRMDGSHLFVFVTRSFQSKFKSKVYVSGGPSADGTYQTAHQWCVSQHFHRGFGFDDDGWDFAPGTMASSILDWERRHLEQVGY